MNFGKLDRNEPSFLRTALSLAIPIAFQNLLTSCASLIDTAMVVGLGNASTSAMGIAARFSFLLNVICFGFASGCASLLSQFWGAKDRENVRKCVGLVLTFAMGFALLYAGALGLFPTKLASLFTDEDPIAVLAGGYLRVFAMGVPFLVFCQVMCISLRSVECVNIPLISSAIAVVVNTFLNYCLINGHFGMPALGLRGAAFGSVAGFVVQAVFILLAVCLRENPIRGRFRDFFRFGKDFVKKYLGTAFPVLLNESLWALGANVYVMVLARQGVENHTGYTLYENIQQIFFVFFVGICGACSVIVGMRVGRGDHDDAYKAARWFSIATPVMGVILGTVLILVRTPLLSLFPIETEGARLVASNCLLFYGFWISIRMIPYTMICGIFRAGGGTRAGCIFDLLGVYVFGIPTMLCLDFFLKPANFVVYVAVMFIAEDVPKGILCIRYFRSRKWIRQVTESK